MQQAMSDDTSPGTPGASSLDPPSLSADDLFHVLQNERRRLAIRYLLDHPGPVDVPTLVDQVTAWELQTTVDDLPDDQRQRIYIDLYQSQLPKLDDHGFVDYDQSRAIVEPAVALELVDPDLVTGLPAEQQGDGATDDPDRRALTYYTLATGVSVLLVGLAAFGSLIAVPLSFKAVAVVVTALYGAVTAGLLVGGIR